MNAAPGGLLPPAMMLVAILLMTGLHFVLPWVQLLMTPWRLFGAVPLGFGILLNIWADPVVSQR